MYFNARWLDVSTGRFAQADSIIPPSQGVQAWDRYAYTNNSPVNFTDPRGHKAVCGEYGEECGEDELDALTGVIGGSKPKDMKSSDKLVEMIIYWENAGGYPDQYPYEDMGGTCTIGYGHVLINPGKEGCSGWPNHTWNANNPLSLEEAEYILAQDINNVEMVIKKTITADLTQAQFDALVSYIFNSGGESNQPFRTKGIPELINSGNYQGAADAIASGPITSGKPPMTSDKLIERRLAEATLFLYGIYVP
jgi:lysozyme